MKLRILGKCRPGKWFGCNAPVDASGLEQLVCSIPHMQHEGIVNILTSGQMQKPMPPNSVNSIIAVVAHPDNKQYGLFHWKDMQTIWLKRSTLEEIVKRKLFGSGDQYARLVQAITALGLEAVDVELYGGSHE
jgi:hypothetical protein